MKYFIISLFIILLLLWIIHPSLRLDISTIPYYRNNPDIPVVSKKFIKNNLEQFMTPYNYSNRMLFTMKTSENIWTEKKEKSTKDLHALTFIRMMGGLLCGKSVAMVTGGSSGEYFYQWFNIKDFIRGTYGFTQCLRNGGVTFYDKIFVYYTHGSNSIKILDLIHCMIPRISHMEPKIQKDGDISVEETQRFVDHINSKKPAALIIFPAMLFRHCQNIYKNGIEITHFPKFMDLSAESLFTCQYMFIKNIFKGSDIRMSYGSIELGQVAQQIPYEEWTSDNDMFTYRIFKNLCDAENGENGTMVMTSYAYHTLPMVRYDTGDKGFIQGDMIFNLIGKSPEDILEVNSSICTLNELGCGIIDYKMNDGTVYITVLNNTPEIRQNVRSIFGKDSIITVCDSVTCKTKGDHNKKVIPFS